ARRVAALRALGSGHGGRRSGGAVPDARAAAERAAGRGRAPDARGRQLRDHPRERAAPAPRGRHRAVRGAPGCARRAARGQPLAGLARQPRARGRDPRHRRSARVGHERGGGGERALDGVAARDAADGARAERSGADGGPRPRFRLADEVRKALALASLILALPDVAAADDWDAHVSARLALGGGAYIAEQGVDPWPLFELALRSDLLFGEARPAQVRFGPALDLRTEGFRTFEAAGGLA